MVLRLVEAAIFKYFPTQYVVHIALAFLVCVLLHTFSQGRKTDRERDLHARTIIVTGGFTPLGLTLLRDLALRGAHIILLSPLPLDDPHTTILISLLRTTTGNDQIFAEQCDILSPSSIRSFCTRFSRCEDQRLDALVFAHEYPHVGALHPFRGNGNDGIDDKERKARSLATFLILTLLLPVLLVAPVERDIRIVTVVNPFYAAAAFSPYTLPDTVAPSIILKEGIRSLKTIIITRHLQRILDALPSAQVPKTSDASTFIPVVSQKAQKSNIVAVSVTPGISRLETVAHMLGIVPSIEGAKRSLLGFLLYILLQPLLRLFTKSSTSSIQSILHVLFLPTPFKLLTKEVDKATPVSTTVIEENAKPEEVLKPGALYRECAVVKLDLPPPKEDDTKEAGTGVSSAQSMRSTTQSLSPTDDAEEMLTIMDDGEYGGEHAGRLVWEAYELALKLWEKADPRPVPIQAPTFKESKEKSMTETKVIPISKGMKDEENVNVYA